MEFCRGKKDVVLFSQSTVAQIVEHVFVVECNYTYGQNVLICLINISGQRHMRDFLLCGRNFDNTKQRIREREIERERERESER
jgi:hypothetical protein